jgi:hypothetical protein
LPNFHEFIKKSALIDFSVQPSGGIQAETIFLRNLKGFYPFYDFFIFLQEMKNEKPDERAVQKNEALFIYTMACCNNIFHPGRRS